MGPGDRLSCYQHPHAGAEDCVWSDGGLSGAPHTCEISGLRNATGDFPGGAVVKNPPANAGDTGSSPGLGRSHMPRSN